MCHCKDVPWKPENESIHPNAIAGQHKYFETKFLLRADAFSLMRYRRLKVKRGPLCSSISKNESIHPNAIAGQHKYFETKFLLRADAFSLMRYRRLKVKRGPLCSSIS